jgi:tetratricopeptide (TPR) repeat protein
MQKKSKIIIISVVTAILLIVGVFMAVTIVGADNSAQAVATEKLSLGQKFLLDLEYDKAVAEFQAVIDIEPKNVDAYIGLADAYIGMGEEEKAIETLEKGLSETGDEKIQAKLDEMKKPEETTAEVTTTPEETPTVETTTTPEVTTTVATTTAPKVARTEREDYHDGYYGIIEYDSKGNRIKKSCYNPDGMLNSYDTYEYDSKGNKIKESWYNGDGTLMVIYEYDSNGNRIKESYYNGDGTLINYYINEYDSNGNKIKESCYYPDGTPV